MKSVRTKRIELLDTLFSELIRTRDQGVCQRCGKVNKSAQCAHIWSRSNYAVRWDPDNAICMCFPCHIRWAHRKPLEFAEWCHERLGETRWEALKQRSQQIVKVNTAYLDATEAWLRDAIDQRIQEAA